MNFFLDALRRWNDFSGRSRRSEYWFFVLFQFITLVAAMLIDSLVWEWPILYLLCSLGLIVPSLAVLVRRLHDTDRSGWFFLIGLIPLIGGIILLVWLATDGTPGKNKWGYNPKEEPQDDIADHLVA